MKAAKIILSIIAILSAILGLTKIIPFNIAYPIMLVSLATILLFRGIEYRNNRERTGFIVTTLTATVVYILVLYILFIR